MTGLYSLRKEIQKRHNLSNNLMVQQYLKYDLDDLDAEIFRLESRKKELEKEIQGTFGKKGFGFRDKVIELAIYDNVLGEKE